MGGYLHARPGIAPLEEIGSRPPMVPLSTGWLEHWMEGHRHRQWAGTILFNRRLVDAIEPVGEGDLEFGVTSYPIRSGTIRPGTRVLPAAEGWADEP
jgi:hypothetical protein